MLKRGEVYENPVTGERVVILVGTDETLGERVIAELTVRKGRTVPVEHIHPNVHERFTVVGGRIGFVLNGMRSTAEDGQTVYIPPGVSHDWWKEGDEDAMALVEVRPAARFEEFIRNRFGLAQDGKTDAKGIPGLLQRALLLREFRDVIQVRRQSHFARRLVLALTAAVARLFGYRGSYPKYLNRPPSEVLPLEVPTNGHRAA